ncbi:MAG TPA: PEP-CTERM sorting domain-containing protein [Bryobacteraceae bacterium]|nr:PEP-CTERM sorting domain-containing protein [Bryobacteraceae bacterium]
MTKGGKTRRFLGCSWFILLLPAIAQAGTLNVTLNPFPGTDSFAWGTSVGYLGTPAPLPDNLGYTFESLGSTNSATVSFSSTDLPDPLTITDGEGAIFEAGSGGTFNWPVGSVFTSGSFLLGTNLNSSLEPDSAQQDTMTLTLSQPVSAFGIFIQDFDTADSFSATIGTTSDGGASFTQSSGSDGSAFFIGLYDVNGDADISDIELTTTQAANNGTPGYFVIGAAQFNQGNETVSSVPEPGTILLAAGGLAALGWKARKRVRA